MSATSPITKRLGVLDIMSCKRGEPLVCITSYTTPMARIMDRHADILLVGDSLGMVVYGLSDTLGVTLEMMINHTQAVVRGSSRAMVVVDMPFGSVGESFEASFRNAARVMAESGAGAVKIEGGVEMAPTVRYLVERGIPVCAHIGLRPQMVHTMGGFRMQGRTEAAARAVEADALAMSKAGVFAMVIEGTVAEVAAKITRVVDVPTIGIGASVDCDGQILVGEDLLGLFTDFTPRFVKRYANMAVVVDKAMADYARDVRTRQFPGPEHQLFNRKNNS